MSPSANGTRTLCAWSPDWAIANWRRRNPSAAPCDAFALVIAERGARRLHAVDAGAARLGLFAGQKATDATALVPDLILADAEPEADAAALTALVDWCVRFSPAVAPDPPDGLFLDIAGLTHLWGGETTLAADFARRLAANGLFVRLAIADAPGAAWALARFGADRAIVPPGGERGFIAPLPTAALRLPPPLAAQLARLGLARVGDLEALPRDQVARRFGAEFLLRLDQALGRAGEALAWRRPPTPWFARLAFAEPISAPEDLARVTRDILTVLCARLEAEARGARRFELAFHRLDGVVQPLVVGLALPGRDIRAIARLFAPKLEGVDPGFGIEVVTLVAAEVEALAARQARLDGEGPAAVTGDEAIAPLVDGLANRLGPGAVWRARPFPSHAPERAVERAPPLGEVGPDVGAGGGWDPERPRPLRLLRRPEPIEVMAPIPDDPPVFFRWRGVSHRVRRAEGPERLAEEWWRRPLDTADPSHVRDYYRVEDEAGARFWLFRAGLYQADVLPRWWLHGLFG